MKKLVIYLVCEPETPELAEAAVDGGADIVELGIPFQEARVGLQRGGHDIPSPRPGGCRTSRGS